MSAINKLIDLYKNKRKQKYLEQSSSYNNKYAFVGVGNHSISNLYPIVDFLAVPLKYISTSRIENATKLALKYKDCTGTIDLDVIGNDKDVKGVFVCTSPSSHFSIVKKLLTFQKNVFVEKPPCKSLSELEELIHLSKNNEVVVGVQKRYSKINSILKSKLNNAISYNGKYLTGAYPEGDELLDIFIHPIDNCVYLFGDVKDLNSKKVVSGSGVTYFVTLEHTSGVVGNLEFSTAYSWSLPKDELSVNTKNNVFEANYPNTLTSYDKPATILNIPIEKVLKQDTQITYLYQNTGFVPVREFNSLSTQGYFSEIETFVNLTEGRKTKNLSNLKSLLPTYKIIERLRK